MKDDSTARAVVALIVCSALALLAILVFFFAPAPSAEKYALLILGALIAFSADIKQFYFGSSSGSKSLSQAQTDTVNKLTDAVATSSPVIVSPPDKRIESTPPTPPRDDALEAFRLMAKQANPQATDAEIERTWAALKANSRGVDIPT